ncbi:MAG: hypothetical protein V4638_10905 [Bacteroidota bacterium]
MKWNSKITYLLCFLFCWQVRSLSAQYSLEFSGGYLKALSTYAPISNTHAFQAKIGLIRKIKPWYSHTLGLTHQVTKQKDYLEGSVHASYLSQLYPFVPAGIDFLSVDVGLFYNRLLFYDYSTTNNKVQFNSDLEGNTLGLQAGLGFNKEINEKIGIVARVFYQMGIAGYDNSQLFGINAGISYNLQDKLKPPKDNFRSNKLMDYDSNVRYLEMKINYTSTNRKIELGETYDMGYTNAEYSINKPQYTLNSFRIGLGYAERRFVVEFDFGLTFFNESFDLHYFNRTYHPHAPDWMSISQYNERHDFYEEKALLLSCQFLVGARILHPNSKLNFAPIFGFSYSHKITQNIKSNYYTTHNYYSSTGGNNGNVLNENFSTGTPSKLNSKNKFSNYLVGLQAYYTFFTNWKINGQLNYNINFPNRSIITYLEEDLLFDKALFTLSFGIGYQIPFHNERKLQERTNSIKKTEKPKRKIKQSAGKWSDDWR